MIILYFTIFMLLIGLVLTCSGHYMRGKLPTYSIHPHNCLLRYKLSLNISALGYGAIVVTTIVLIHLGIMMLLMR